MMLTVPESLFLLSRKNETGQQQGQFTSYAFAGAALADLLLMQRVVPDAEKPKHLNITDTSPTGNAFLDDVLGCMSKKGSGKSAQSYVSAIAMKSKLLNTLADGLVERGVVSEDKKSFLVFSWNHYPEANPEIEAELVGRLSAILFEDKAPEARDCVIIALAERTGLLPKNFDKAMLKTHKARVKSIAAGEAGLTKPTLDAITAIQVVLVMTAVMPAIVATSS